MITLLIICQYCDNRRKALYFISTTIFFKTKKIIPISLIAIRVSFTLNLLKIVGDFSYHFLLLLSILKYKIHFLFFKTKYIYYFLLIIIYILYT